MRHRYWPTWAIMSVCFLVILTGCGSSQPPKESSDHNKEDLPSVIHIPQETQQTLGMTVVPSEIKELEKTLQVTGQIAQDTERVVHVNPPEAGVVKELLVTIGERVEQGAPLATIFSSKSQSPIQIVAPRSGLILGIHTIRGASVDTLSSLMTIADLSQVWATFDLYEQDVALVKVGQRIEAQSVAYPDRIFPGKIVFVSPQVDPHTRTIKVRAQIENADYALKLGMFVTGTLYVPTAEKALVVPHGAIQRIEDERIVFVQTGPESFEAREVIVGEETRIHIQILEGLKPGESIVASGSFHLKAEFLKGTLEEGHSH